MARRSTAYRCEDCGAVQPKWAGRCDACGAWSTLVEEVLDTPGGRRPSARRAPATTFVSMNGAPARLERRMTAIAELDRVTGGGLVPGSALLVGGDPGIGKSTLLLQAAAALSSSARVAYISGEEAVDQLRLRAARLDLATAPVQLATATSVTEIVAALDVAEGPEIVVVDSIQTMFVDALESAPGTVAQVRASAQELIRLAKRRGFILLLVGHVTKEGMIAGPRVLEHMVDTVLYFEGERGHQFRILRAVKNRFGATDEIGVFEMTDGGLVEVPNPSQLFLADRDANVAGAAVFAGMEGTRPVLVEIQALAAPTAFGTPRRAVVGWDSARLAMILAVLETRCGMRFGTTDVFLNVAGGLKISEPACDLAVAAALISAIRNAPVPAETVVFGEVGLAGEVRPVARADARLKEAAKLGFARAIIPTRRSASKLETSGVEATEVAHVSQLLRFMNADTEPARPRREVSHG